MTCKLSLGYVIRFAASLKLFLIAMNEPSMIGAIVLSLSYDIILHLVNQIQILVSIVVLILSRICFRQVEPSAILSGTSPRVSQGVLLSLVLQLSSELSKDTGHKLQWIKEAALALNPDDPHLGKYMRQCLEQAYQNCHCLMGVTTIPSEQANLRLVIHVMNSLMSSCK